MLVNSKSISSQYAWKIKKFQSIHYATVEQEHINSATKINGTLFLAREFQILLRIV